MSENRFEYAEKISVKELADYFLKLADGFISKSLEFQGKGQTIALTPEEITKQNSKSNNIKKRNFKTAVLCLRIFI